VALLLLVAPLQAGPLFVAGEMQDGKFIPAPDVKAPWYGVRYSNANVRVEGETVQVQVEEILDGPEKAIRSVGLLPLPEGVDGKSVRLTLAIGTAQPTGPEIKPLTAQEAQALYGAIARGTGRANILALSGRSALLLPKVELQGKVQLTITFRAAVRQTQGVNWLACPMPAASWGRGSVERLTLNVTLHSKEPLRTIFSPTHETTVQRKGLYEATASVKAGKWSGADEFRLYWVADRDDLGLRVLSYRGPGKEDGFFMLLGNPTGTAGVERVVDKDVLFVLDTSGSMRGEKIEQARSAIDYCLQHLNRGDRFNIITFGTEVRSFRDELTEQTPVILAAAREYIESVVANGRTNIGGALVKALAGKADPGRPRIMIFLTDGAPTAGELVPDKILEQVKKSNTSQTKIFIMGVGNDVNAHLLDKLAELTEGSSEYVAPREELDAKIAALYDRLSHPVLSGVKVRFGELTTLSVLPPSLPVLFKGSEIMIVGRFKEGGRHMFTISGTLFGKPLAYTCAVVLPRGTGEPVNEFLAPLWAARQIGFLLQEIRLHGENKELIEEVVRLSRQYGIVTEYTEFLAWGGAALSREEALRHARNNLTAARAEQSGQWAVNQAFNDRALQKRAVATNEANVYRDRRGQVMSAQNISQLGRRAFYLHDGQWVDSEEAGSRKTRIVKLFSPEYFDLLKADPVFAQAQQLGWALSINVGQERIVVEKDGQQKDESLRTKSQPKDIEEPGLNQQIPQQQLPRRNQRGLAPLEQIRNQQLQPRRQ
jgi:Ca-activated chloride channel family protein